jgi:hypothetical protein
MEDILLPRHVIDRLERCWASCMQQAVEARKSDRTRSRCETRYRQSAGHPSRHQICSLSKAG